MQGPCPCRAQHHRLQARLCGQREARRHVQAADGESRTSTWGKGRIKTSTPTRDTFALSPTGPGKCLSLHQPWEGPALLTPFTDEQTQPRRSGAACPGLHLGGPGWLRAPGLAPWGGDSGQGSDLLATGPERLENVALRGLSDALGRLPVSLVPPHALPGLPCPHPLTPHRSPRLCPRMCRTCPGTNPTSSEAVSTDTIMRGQAWSPRAAPRPAASQSKADGNCRVSTSQAPSMQLGESPSGSQAALHSLIRQQLHGSQGRKLRPCRCLHVPSAWGRRA